MPNPKPFAHVHPSDLRALTRMLTDATTGVTDLVEAVHIGIAPPAVEGRPATGIAPLTYRTIRNVTRFVGGGVDAALGRLTPLIGERDATPERRAVLAALNGVMGDYLAETGNPLAVPMSFTRNGSTLPPERSALTAAFPEAGGKLLVLVHGLCMNEQGWLRGGSDLGSMLTRDLGYTPLTLTYNSGLHVSTNGRALAELLEIVLREWPQPVSELTIVGHSMGGLVARSAVYHGAAAGLAWPGRLRALVFLGTPHHGAPLERGGNWINVLMDATPYVAPFARLGKSRSAGITDLRYGNLLDEDWNDRDRFAHADDDRRIIPLPLGVACFAAAATVRRQSDPLADRLLGDGLVPLDSALGRHKDPARALPFAEPAQWVGYSMNHLDLLSRPEVHKQVAAWLGDVTATE